MVEDDQTENRHALGLSLLNGRAITELHRKTGLTVKKKHGKDEDLSLTDEFHSGTRMDLSKHLAVF